MVKITHKVSQAIAEYIVNSPPRPINVSFIKVCKWLFFITSGLKAIKDRRLFSGLVFLITVTLVGKRFFKRKVLSAPTGSNLSGSIPMNLSDLLPEAKHHDKCFFEDNGKGIFQVSRNCLKISPSEKKAYFQELLAVFEAIKDQRGEKIMKEIKEKISLIQPSDEVIEDVEAYTLPANWINAFSSP